MTRRQRKNKNTAIDLPDDPQQAHNMGGHMGTLGKYIERHPEGRDSTSTDTDAATSHGEAAEKPAEAPEANEGTDTAPDSPKATQTKK